MLTVRSTINIASQTVPPIIPVVQGDTGRAILFTLADFTIPAGATATYYVQKPSGEAVYNNATIDGNNVLVELTAQSIIEKGDNYGQVRITVGEEVVTSFDFILLVKEFRGIDAVQSLTEMNIFDKAVEQASEAIDEVKTDALDDIGDAKDAALQEIDQSTGNFADDFSASITYAAGDYVMHSGQLYRFTANHAAGAWTGSDAEAVTVGEELTDLKAESTSLKDDFSDNLYLLDNNAVDMQNPVFWKGGTISGSGVITTARTYNNAYTTLITFPIRYGLNNSIYPTLYLIKYLNGVFVSRTSIGSGGNTGAITPDSTFDSYRLMIITASQTPVYTVAQMVANGFKYIESMRKYDEELETTKINLLHSTTLISADWFTRGYVNNSGTEKDDSTNGAIISDIIYVPSVLVIPSTMQYNICTYSDGVFVSRGGWVTGTGEPVTITESEYRVIIAWSANQSTDYTVAFTLAGITWFGTKLAYDSTQVMLFDTRLEFLNKVNCSWTGSKICHYSVDDVYAILKDLTDNAETYTSIYDNTTLSALKAIHDSTGLCITLNTFNTTSADSWYSISNVPQKTTFQNEFQTAKSWLRFAFHAENDTANYATSSGISSAYDTFVSAIYKLTGDYECIDGFTRLGFFGGTLANVLAIKNKAHGITGLLCADDTSRDSYYLDADQNTIVQGKGMYVDAENEIVFLKTITRTASNMTAEIEGNLCYQKYVELFSHEYETSWVTTCSTMATWLKNNGYVFAFPSEIIV